MSFELDIFFRSIRFFGGEPTGRGFHVVEVEGWTDGVDSESENIKIPNGDGYYDTESTLSSRSVTARGWCDADTLQGLGQLEDQLKSIQGRPLSEFIVGEFDDERWAMAKADVRPRFQPHGWAPYANWAMSLVCPKPQKFGALNEFAAPAGAVLTLPNYGNRTAAITLTVEGDMPSGYRINGPDGKTFQVTAALLAGHPHTIELASGLLVIDGAIRYRATPIMHLWTVPAAWKVDMTLVPVSGTGQLTASALNTYG